MWTSGPAGMPQSLCIDLGNHFRNADGHTLSRIYSTFGFKMAHAFASNPAKIVLNFSPDGNKFQTWAIIDQISFKAGMHLFSVDPKSSDQVRFIQVVVCDTFGANRTYLTQVFLYASEK